MKLYHNIACYPTLFFLHNPCHYLTLHHVSVCLPSRFTHLSITLCPQDLSCFFIPYSRQPNGPLKMSMSPLPEYVNVVFFTWQKGLCKCDKVKDLVLGNYPRLLGWVQ